ncbi:zinc finger and BTB domain-containing protein 8A [Diretmus argenteus]
MIRINNTQYFHFLKQADNLRRSGSLCDAIISVENETFRAHRLVLACASRRLAQQLTQADTDSPVHCTLELFSPHTFQQVLDFTYTQTLEVPVDDLHLLLRAAQLLEMQHLEEQCRRQLDTLDCRVTEEEERSEITQLKEEMGTTASSFPSQVHSLGYSGIHHPYTQHLYAGSPGMGDIVKQGLLKRKNPSHKAFIGTIQTSEQRYPEEHKAGTERVKDCHHCSTSLLGAPLQQESTSTPSGEACRWCRLCERGDGVQHTLQSHQHDHSVEKPYQCQHCPKRFSLKHQLDTHHRIHTGEKPFECRLCGQRSRDYSAMIKHLRTHGGASPYQCTVCLEFCSSLVSMQRHVKSHAVQDFPPDWSISSTYLYTSHV